MASIKDILIADSNTAKTRSVASGLERTLCSPDFCDSRTLTVYRRTILAGKALELDAGDDYHVVYVIELDVSRLTALGWSPRTPLDEGIARTYEWYLGSHPVRQREPAAIEDPSWIADIA